MSVGDPVVQPAATSPANVVPTPGVPAGPVIDLYDESVSLSQVLTTEQVELFKQNQLTSFNPVAAILLAVFTLGIFPAIYYGLVQGKLPVVKPGTDPSPGKAIGFQFIPYFNIYWQCVVYARLVDRINFQLRLRGKPAVYSRQRAGWVLLIPFVNMVLGLMNIYQGQMAINEIAAERGA
jgi:hypothetical protein